MDYVDRFLACKDKGTIGFVKGYLHSDYIIDYDILGEMIDLKFSERIIGHHVLTSTDGWVHIISLICCLPKLEFSNVNYEDNNSPKSNYLRTGGSGPDILYGRIADYKGYKRRESLEKLL